LPLDSPYRVPHVHVISSASMYQELARSLRAVPLVIMHGLLASCCAYTYIKCWL